MTDAEAPAGANGGAAEAPEAPTRPEDPGLGVCFDAGATLLTSLGQDVAVVPREKLVEVCERLRDEAAFTMLVTLSCVDYLGYESGAAAATRFEVVVNLLSHPRKARLRLRVPVGEEDATLPSITGVWAAANWYEREVFDMFGLTFTGHPDLTRILMPDDWIGHPLRKDYLQGKVPVQFKANPKQV